MIKKWSVVENKNLREISIPHYDLNMEIENGSIKVLTISDGEVVLRLVADWSAIKVCVPTPPTMIKAFRIQADILPGVCLDKFFKTEWAARDWRDKFLSQLVTSYDLPIIEVDVPEDFCGFEEEN